MRVVIPTHLRDYTGGAAEVDAAGTTLGAVVKDLDRQYPGIRFRAVDEQDRVRPHIKLFVDGELAADLSATVDDRSEVHIIAALSGG